MPEFGLVGPSWGRDTRTQEHMVLVCGGESNAVNDFALAADFSLSFRVWCLFGSADNSVGISREFAPCDAGLKLCITIQQLKTSIASVGAKVVDPARHEGRSELFDKLPGLKNLIEQGDFKSSTQLLSEAQGSGKITQLELTQLAVQFPGLIVDGVNNHSFSDNFRSILINSLSNLEDPLAALSELTLEDEPNQGFSAKISSLIAGIVDANSAVDPRVVSVIKKLFAGNEMSGGKVNLCPVLAQMAAMGDDSARALIQDRLDNSNIYSPGLRSLLNPPASDEQGNDLSAAVIYSIQYNKGKWSDRSRQLQHGDVALSIGDVRVTDAASFHTPLRDSTNLIQRVWLKPECMSPIRKFLGSIS